MPRTVVPEDVKGPLQLRRTLYHRCRRGEPEALATLLYRQVDRLYTAASYVTPDETAALTAVVLAWEDLLALLVRPYVGGYLQDKSFKLLGKHLLDYADRRTVRRALRNAERESEEGLLTLPEEQLRPLVDLIPSYASQIAANYHGRSVVRRRSIWVAGLVALLFCLGLIWQTQAAQSPAADLQLECLQQRIERGGLIDALRDTLLELPDAAGADQPQARALQHASLVLEELSNAPSWRGSPGLPYVVARVQEERLAETLAEIAQGYEGDARSSLVKTQLVLEEVQNL
ncbi:MAG: hypothetical protein WCP21_05360, partial [Armatimonadota bacterium]